MSEHLIEIAVMLFVIVQTALLAISIGRVFRIARKGNAGDPFRTRCPKCEHSFWVK